MTERTWPDLAYDAWADTCQTLHRWTQVVGKIRLVQSPYVNHTWHCPLYLTARGLTTSPIPHGDRLFSIDFDFVSHRLVIQPADDEPRILPLEPMSVATFYARVMESLDGLGLPVSIYTTPNEIPDAEPLDRDQTHAAYDAAAAERFWRALLQMDRVLKRFRSRFIGKCSPVHFFWGSFDLAVTRFSGRPAPPHPAGIPNMPDAIARESYSHEVSSVGFWPGNPDAPQPVFYAYAYPTPEGFGQQPVRPDAAFYSEEMGEFFLPYDAVRNADDPDAALLDFCQSTYEAAANLAKWDRDALERDFSDMEAITRPPQQ